MAHGQFAGVGGEGLVQAHGDARAVAVLAEMAIDQGVAAERLDEVDIHRHGRFAFRAGLEMFRPHAEQDVASVALRGNEVHRRRADEAGDEGGGRLFIDFQRRADLLGTSVVHHHHALRQGHRLDLVVRDIQAGGGQAPVQGLKFGAHLHAQLRIQVRQRLVEEEYRRLAHDGAAHRHALALPARQLARLALEQLGEFEDFRRARHARLDLVLRQAADLQAVGHVVGDLHVRVEGVVLEHHGNVAVLRLEVRDAALADGDVALADGLQPGHHAQQGRLAAAGGADDDDELAVLHVHVEAVDDLGAAEGLAHTAKTYLCHRIISPFQPVRARTSAA